MIEHARAAVPRPAATLALLREGAAGNVEVFLLKRHARSPFMPDVYVFPGGAVDQGDRQLANALAATPACGATQRTEPGLAYRVAALRECFEEAGVLLASRDGVPLSFGPREARRYRTIRRALHDGTLTFAHLVDRESLSLATDALVYWAHWITPEASERRFEARFFLAAMPEGQRAAHDRREATAGLWIAPETAMDWAERGTVPIADVTRLQLLDLAGLSAVLDAYERFHGVTPHARMPRLTYEDGYKVLAWPPQPDGD